MGEIELKNLLLDKFSFYVFFFYKIEIRIFGGNLREQLLIVRNINPKYIVDMENKIQELTDKIYREGVEKGNDEAKKIVDKAQAEAQAIIERGKKEAETILLNSRKSANELAENTKSELKLYAGQALQALKSEIASVVSNGLVNNSVKEFTQNKDFLNAFIVQLASKWSVEEPIVISTEEADSLKAYFATHAKTLLDKGVKIEQVNGNKTLFSVSPADGSYKVNFGEEEFMNYFKEFLRPQLVEMLF